MKLWAGRFHKELDPKTNDFNSSISFDSRMYQEDIQGSIAHATMLGACGIIDKEESEKLCAELEKISQEITDGTLPIDPNAEDIHTFVEGELTQRLGSTGKRLHTARSRNDQVALDVRMTLKKEADGPAVPAERAVHGAGQKGREYSGGHYARLYPSSAGPAHHLRPPSAGLWGDVPPGYWPSSGCGEAHGRNAFGFRRSGGDHLSSDRQMTAELLGFSQVSRNSLDGVSDRDFCMELASAVSIAMVHLSRFSEEIILWCSWEF